MDEAGGTPRPSSIRSAKAIFRSFQLRARPLRNLSLGVLIVCGGTLAALPFRRYQSIPDASNSPTQVTGPAHSVLKASELAPETNAEQLPSLAEMDRLISPHDAFYRSASPPPRRRQHVDIPLTYDDLAVPLDQPKPIRERFNATTTVRKQQLQEDRIAELVMPPMESLPIADQQELSRVADTFVQPGTSGRGQASGRFASTPSASNSPFRADEKVSVLDTTPTAQAETRQRHWIRQPGR